MTPGPLRRRRTALAVLAAIAAVALPAAPASAELGEAVRWEAPPGSNEIAVSPRGVVYVARPAGVSIFTRHGEPRAELTGSPEGPFLRVTGVAASADAVYVVDGDAHRVHRFSPEGAHTGGFGTDQPDDPTPEYDPDPDPGSSALDRAGNLSLLEWGRVKRFRPDGTYLGATRVDLWSYDLSLGDDGTIFTALSFSSFIGRFDPGGGSWAYIGSRAPQYNPGRGTFTEAHAPTSTTVDHAGAVWGDDLPNSRLHRFEPGGRLIQTCRVAPSFESGSLASAPDGTLFLLTYRRRVDGEARVIRIENLPPGRRGCDATEPGLERLRTARRFRLTRRGQLPGRVNLGGRIDEPAVLTLTLLPVDCRQPCPPIMARRARHLRPGSFRIRLRGILGSGRVRSGVYRAQVSVRDETGLVTEGRTRPFRLLPPRR